ncbi:MAG: hypothetical protein JWO09_1681 [Bacteroidetes bacterium]|nr:hypothetical protein [Bacteroidota bacterium]
MSKYIYKLLSLVLLSNLATTGILKAQTPASCLEIESVLADACGSPEGENEMVRFKIGPAPINISNLNVNWPNGSFLGISSVNTTTNGIVSALNATIVSCGYLVQPAGGVLPAGKTVLLVSSTNISLSANSFANLTDTLIVIFQNAGNTAGHFVNYSSTPGLRTLVISRISPACSDAVTYDKSLLVNQAGGHGGSSALNDGATIEFTWPGAATYINNGCMAPISTITSNAGSGAAICAGGTVSLSGTAGGNYTGVIWQGGQGSFSSSTNLNTNYTAAATESGTVVLSLGVIGHCNDTVFSTVNLTISPLPNAAITASATAICAGDPVTLNASGAGTYSWSTGSAASSITVFSAGTYTLTVTNSCGSQTATQTIAAGSAPSVSIQSASASFCAGSSMLLYATGSGSFMWTGGSVNDSILVTTEGLYSVTASNGCGSASDSVFVNVDSITAFFTASALTGPAPLSVDFTSNSSASAIALSWDLGNGSGASGNLASTVYQSPGTYPVTLTATNAAGCSDTYTLTIVVPEGASALQMPNVFTPNGDGINDQFAGIGSGIKEFSCKVYNRWGTMVTELSTFKSSWDGRTTSGVMASDGTYFYFMEATGADGKAYREKGFVELIGE